MIKKTILMLLVLVGGVVSTNAGNVSVYIKPTGGWLDASPFLGVWVYNSSDEDNTKTWATITEVSGQDGVYCATFADTQNKLIIVRLNPSGSNNPDWDNKWNESAKLDIYPDRLYTISNAANNSSATITYLPWELYFMSTKSGDWKVEKKMNNTSGTIYSCGFSGSEFAGKRVGWAPGDAFNENGSITDWSKKYQSTSTNTESSDHWITFKNFGYSNIVQGGGSTWKVPPTNDQYNDGTITITFNKESGATDISSKKSATINATAGYATYSNDEPYVVSGAEVFVVTDKGSSYVHLEPLAAGTVLAAKAGVILKGSGDVEILSANDNPTTYSGSNYLVGSGNNDQSVSAGTGIYVFSWVGSDPTTVGFYLASGTGTLGAHKAYLDISESPAPYLGFDFGDDTTGINTVGSMMNDGAIYSLSGARLNKLQKGINIVNGKKVIVK